VPPAPAPTQDKPAADPAPLATSEPAPPAVEPPKVEAPAVPPIASSAAGEPAVSQTKSIAPASAAADAAKPAIKLDPVEKSSATFDAPVVDPAAAPQSAADTPAEPEDPADTPAAPGGASPGGDATGALSEGEIHERLKASLVDVRFVKVPLAEFVAFVGDFTALRITIDDAALDRAGKKRGTPITVELKRSATAHEALRAAVEPLGLACVVRDGRLVVTTADEAGAPAR
jgi:hypothetical protein